MQGYEDLRLDIERREGSTYRVRVRSAAGEASADFDFPFSHPELELFLLKVGRSRSTGVRRLQTSEQQQAKEFGTKLFDSVFRGRIGDIYRASQSRAEVSDSGLRLTLQLTDVPDLMNCPWEFLHDPVKARFLSISPRTPIVRNIDVSAPIKPFRVEPPLRLLGMVSNPESGPGRLDVEREQGLLETALGRLIDSGLVHVEWLPRPTLGALLDELREHEYHIFHYIGHGAYDSKAGDGLLLLRDEEGGECEVTGDKLGDILHDFDVRLAVLNACEGARGSEEDPFAGVAAALIQDEIPAVVAMQFEITDQAAITFARVFYSRLAVGTSVDAAVADARKSIYADANDNLEWATPVLFMRVPDGRIFDIDQTSSSQLFESSLQSTAGPARATQSTGPSAEPTAPPPAVPAPQAGGVETIEVGRSPIGLAIGHGAVWVAARDDNAVRRIDIASREVSDRIPVGENLKGIAAGEHAIWIATATPSMALRDKIYVWRVDPVSLDVGKDSLSIVGTNEGKGIAAADSTVWVSAFRMRGGFVTRIDERKGKITNEAIRARCIQIVDMTIAFGALWCATFKVQGGLLTRIDLRTSEMVGAPISVAPGLSVAITADEQSVWVAHKGNQIVSVDPRTNTVKGEPVELDAEPTALAAGHGRLWVTADDHQLYCIDPVSRTVVGDSIEVGDSPSDIAIGEDAVWVSSKGAGTVTRVAV